MKNVVVPCFALIALAFGQLMLVDSGGIGSRISIIEAKSVMGGVCYANKASTHKICYDSGKCTAGGCGCTNQADTQFGNDKGDNQTITCGTANCTSLELVVIPGMDCGA